MILARTSACVEAVDRCPLTMLESASKGNPRVQRELQGACIEALLPNARRQFFAVRQFYVLIEF